MTDTTYQALSEALDDEYKARAAYQAIIAKFGPVRPFSNIIQSEQRHIDALLRLFAKRGWQPPTDRWSGNVPAPATLRDALALGVQAEIDNAGLYDRLFAMTDAPDVHRVFRNLRQASQERHLPAFQRGLQRNATLRQLTDVLRLGNGMGFGGGFGGGGRGLRGCR